MKKIVLSLTLVVLTLAACNTTPDPVASRPLDETLQTVAQQFATPTPIPEALLADITGEELLYINLYERASPSVVNIDIGVGDEAIEVRGGSGFVYDAEGHIVTNYHVVDQAVDIRVTFYDGQVSGAEPVAVDSYSDLAVIRVDTLPEGIYPITLGTSYDLRVGQRVAAIGNPFGLSGTMTIGIISALGRSLPSQQLVTGTASGYSNPDIIQTDAEVNPGNSGGPLLNLRGEVIGVNTAIRTETGSFQGIAFAVPIDTVKYVIPQLIEKGYADYAWLGVESTSLFTVAEMAEPLGLSVGYGVMVTRAIPSGPADQAGIRGGNRDEIISGLSVRAGGDIIIAINGETVRDMDDLVAYLVSRTRPNDIAILTVVRSNQTFDIAVTLGSRPR
ncbi:MAG: trypsin-like peptidase domain-containing protein [Anaerolineae bacterium]|nr:trypsin-like peptidase domain-containing protein [Anaerolineae bacterium]